MLSDHTDEVWHLQFSNDGRWLASVSKDATAIVWEVPKAAVGAGVLLQKRHTLRGHTQALTFCCWNPDDSLLATCSMDSLVKVCFFVLIHASGLKADKLVT